MKMLASPRAKRPFLLALLSVLNLYLASAATYKPQSFPSDFVGWDPHQTGVSGSFILTNESINYVTMGVPRGQAYAAIYSEQTLSYTEPWLVQVDLHVDPEVEKDWYIWLTVERQEGSPEAGYSLNLNRAKYRETHFLFAENHLTAGHVRFLRYQSLRQRGLEPANLSAKGLTVVGI